MTTTLAALALTAFAAAGCSRGNDEDEARARDLQRAMSAYPNQLVSPAELGQQLPPGAGGYGAAPVPVAYVQTPQGLVPVYGQQAPIYGQPAPVYTQPMVVQASAPAPIVRQAPTAGRTASQAPARAPQRKTNATRDAAIGVAVGTIAGAAIGKDVKGALIGAAAGGLLGAVVGSTVDVQHR